MSLSLLRLPVLGASHPLQQPQERGSPKRCPPPVAKWPSRESLLPWVKQWGDLLPATSRARLLGVRAPGVKARNQMHEGQLACRQNEPGSSALGTQRKPPRSELLATINHT